MILSRIIMTILLAVAVCLSGAEVTRADSFTFAGIVTDSGGKPVEQAEIFIYDSATIRRPADFITPRTGKDGAFSIQLPRGKYWAVARVRKGEKFGPLLPGDRHSGEPVEVEPDSDQELRMDFTVVDLREAGQNRQKTREDFVRLSGRILDQDGKPVRDAYAYAGDRGRAGELPLYLSAWTGENGEYALFLPRGSHVVRGSVRYPPDSNEKGKIAVEVVQKDAAADIVIEVVENNFRGDAGHGDKDDD